MEPLATAITALRPSLTPNGDGSSDSRSRAPEHRSDDPDLRGTLPERRGAEPGAIGAPDTHRTIKRREWLRALVSRWEAASGKPFDNARLTVLAAELDAAGYSRAQANAAETWILRGAPARYGALTLADFFPTPEQLASVEYDAGPGMDAEYRRGYETGYAAGTAHEAARWRENEEYLRVQAEASRGVDFDIRMRRLVERETAIEESERRMRERESALEERERRVRRVIERLGAAAEGTP